MLLWVQVGSFFPIFTYCNLSDPGGTIGFQAIVNLLWKNLRLRRLYDVLITVQGLVRSIVDFNIENLGDLKQIICELFFSSSVKYLFQQQLCECEWLGYSKRTINTFKKKVPWQAFSSFTVFNAFQILVLTIWRIGRSTHDYKIWGLISVVSTHLGAQQRDMNHVSGIYPQYTQTGDREDGRGNHGKEKRASQHTLRDDFHPSRSLPDLTLAAAFWD